MEKKSRLRFSLKWTRTDIIAILPTFVIAVILSVFVYFLPQDTEGASVFVYYDGETVTVQNLAPQGNEKDPRYIILFKEEKSDKYDGIYPTDLKFDKKNLLLDDLVIEIKNGNVRIVKETSPNNICSRQGAVNRPNTPLTCAPNYVVVMIKTNRTDDGEIII